MLRQFFDVLIVVLVILVLILSLTFVVGYCCIKVCPESGTVIAFVYVLIRARPPTDGQAKHTHRTTRYEVFCSRFLGFDLLLSVKYS